MSAWTEGLQPGEWRVAPCPSRRVDQWEIHWSAHGECVAETVHGKANADLFAASKRMAEALEKCQRTLALLIAPDAIKSSTVITAYAQCVEAETVARAALARAGAT